MQRGTVRSAMERFAVDHDVFLFAAFGASARNTLCSRAPHCYQSRIPKRIWLRNHAVALALFPLGCSLFWIATIEPISAHTHQIYCRWRPYRVECTGCLPTSEVKRRRARLVLGWGTAREDLRVLPAFRLRRWCVSWCRSRLLEFCVLSSFSLPSTRGVRLYWYHLQCAFSASLGVRRATVAPYPQ